MADTSAMEPLKMSKSIFARWRSPAFKYDAVMFFSGALVAFLLVWCFSTFTTPSLKNPTYNLQSETRPDPKTFYDDPDLSYWVEDPVHNWDEKRRQWLATRNIASSGRVERVLMVTGSQPGPCANPIGDHLLLRLFKNKVDYCRIHGYEIFYNNVLLHPRMTGFWAKYAAIRAAMMAHPETEWIWWVDSDATITDMDFTLPLDKYRNHNLVIHGWPDLLYEQKSWVAVNAGVFLIRNCQWSMDLMTRWAEFGPQSPDYEKWGRVEKSIFKDKTYPGSDDQTALEYLLVKEREKWADKIYLENEYYFQGYWVEIVGKLENVSRRYAEIGRSEKRLRRRHAESSGERYREEWEEYLKAAGTGGYAKASWRRPFVTHFTGCEPCSGDYNDQLYTGEECWGGINKALNFADNQVLRSFGYYHPNLSNSSRVQVLPI